jgi:hypothetical protein
MATKDPLDPRELILESYRIDGITDGECRSIFLDWAIGVPNGEDMKPLIKALLERYASDNPDHPMTQVLTDGLGSVGQTGRRGGRKARVKGA